MQAVVDLRDRFEGCLLGLAIGDALGARFEGQSAEHIQNRFRTVAELIHYPVDGLSYTDDTQMAIGVAETLADHGEIIEEHLCSNFVANYVPARGYGRGARRVLEAMENQEDYKTVARTYFPGGSFGNGAAMRVAPIGLLFHNRRDVLRTQAALSAHPTHQHTLGIVGAELLASAVALCVQSNQMERGQFLLDLRECCNNDEFQEKLRRAATIKDKCELALLGNGIAALESVVTAIASFALSPESFEETIAAVIFLGGDTDTIAAMAGALSGAYLGSHRLPKNLIQQLEDGEKGRTYLIQLACRLFERATKISADLNVEE